MKEFLLTCSRVFLLALFFLCLLSLALEICGCDSATEPESSGWFVYRAPSQTTPWPGWADTAAGNPVAYRDTIRRPSQPQWQE